MAQKSAAALTTDNNNIVVTETAPESITPATLGALLQSFIDSFWNKTDSPFTLPPANIAKADLPAQWAIAANDKRWYKITDRSDSNPLFVQVINGSISPFGIWVKGGKNCFVIMDYVNGKTGEPNSGSSAFILAIDDTQLLTFNGTLKFVNGNQGLGKVLVSDANGLLNYGIAKTPYTSFAPATGNTIILLKNTYNIINPGAGLSALTIQFPGSPADGDFVEFKITQAITTITYSGGSFISANMNNSNGAGFWIKYIYNSNTGYWY